MPRRPAACPSAASSSVVFALPSTDPAAPSAGTSAASQQQKHWPYPAARRDDSIIDTLHGQRIADPYRWLENANSTETKTFVEAENKVAMDYLKQDSRREVYKQTFDQIGNVDQILSIIKKSRYYFTSGSFKDRKNKLTIYRQKSLDAKRELFFDVDIAHKDGTQFLFSHGYSMNGKFINYVGGKEYSQTTIRVVCAEDVEGLCKDKGHAPDVIEGAADWVEWLDDVGFFYTVSCAAILPRLPKDSGEQAPSGTDASASPGEMLYYHAIGTPQSADQLIFQASDSDTYVSSVDYSTDGKWAIVSFDSNGVITPWMLPLDPTKKALPKKPALRRLVNDSKNSYSYIAASAATHGSRLYFVANKGKPQSKVVAYDMNAPNGGFVDVIPASSKYIIEGASGITSNYMLVRSIEGGVSKLAVHELGTDKSVRNTLLPVGVVNSVWTQPRDGEVFLICNSLLYPQIIYRYDFATNALSVVRRSAIAGFDASAFEVRQVSVKDKKGASFPMTIAARKGIKLDGSHPTLMLAREGPPQSYLPQFTDSGFFFMKHFHGVLAIPYLSNVAPPTSSQSGNAPQHNYQPDIDRLERATHYLEKQGYTKPALLAVQGEGDGGTVVAAAESAEGYVRVNMGDPSKKRDFDTMRQYSPLHHVSANRTYPAMLLMAPADPEGKGASWHSYKMAAELQHKLPSNPRPLMLREYPGPSDQYSLSLTLVPSKDMLFDTLSFIAVSLGLQCRA
ncbi:prolyl oligopeptidase [Syncephalis pseudoplumigaleata]|uniref:Prolyl oligopeptidase n=1 Tax=Syncephalis pseudoplumigaleata TaxID=1712513 RepID=A0A4P9YVK7_9FUNG|nr:prolyl oligopeptidase [Syncephalis pseudoplumigaleata]|eukprot:RKP23452.1 prolyl oligopeptidase [Syncephalis pseudoplumigaleata]